MPINYQRCKVIPFLLYNTQTVKILYGKALNNINRIKIIADLISSFEKKSIRLYKNLHHFLQNAFIYRHFERFQPT